MGESPICSYNFNYAIKYEYSRMNTAIYISVDKKIDDSYDTRTRILDHPDKADIIYSMPPLRCTYIVICPKTRYN